MPLALSLTVATALFLTIAIVAWARRRPEYRHARHTISELGETGAADSRAVSLGTFLPVGLAMLSVAWLTRETAPPSAALAACIGTGYAVAAFFPCDPGSPLSGSFRQLLHNIGGGVEYLGGALSLVGLAAVYGSAFTAAGGIVAVSLVALSTPTFPWRARSSESRSWCCSARSPARCG